MPTAGQRIKALDFTAAVKVEDTTSNLNATTTPAVGSPEVGVTFVAPTSGKVLITVGGSMADNGANASTIIDYQLYLGTNASGTLVLGTGSLHRRLILRGGTNNETQEGSKTSLITGLTPGSTYYARTMHLTYSGSTGDIYARSLVIAPQPA